MKNISSVQKTRKSKRKATYGRQSPEQKLLLVALALRHHVRVSHAAVHLNIKQSTATFILRCHKAATGSHITPDLPVVDLTTIAGRCTYQNCKICLAKADLT